MTYVCFCCSQVDIFGTHSLSCRCSGGCIPWHTALNETIRRVLVAQPVSVCCDDGSGWHIFDSLDLHSGNLPVQISLLHLSCLEVVPAVWKIINILAPGTSQYG